MSRSRSEWEYRLGLCGLTFTSPEKNFARCSATSGKEIRMDNERLDLSPLDPMRDQPRWESFVNATLKRVDRALDQREEQRDDAFLLIASWRRPLLAAAAVLVAVLIPAEIALEIRESRAEKISRLASVSVVWARSEQPPKAADILRVIAVGDRQ
jgi:hypothetical protein